jgi:hypothetical protein
MEFVVHKMEAAGSNETLVFYYQNVRRRVEQSCSVGFGTAQGSYEECVCCSWPAAVLCY